jgi:hypothetical protein
MHPLHLLRGQRNQCQQWISEVIHFCTALPIILVGCMKDIRCDARVIDELSKTVKNQSPPKICVHVLIPLYLSFGTLICLFVYLPREWRPEDRRNALSRVLCYFRRGRPWKFPIRREQPSIAGSTAGKALVISSFHPTPPTTLHSRIHTLRATSWATLMHLYFLSDVHTSYVTLLSFQL